jgi:outer membrane receptor protein involved in Fe transport
MREPRSKRLPVLLPTLVAVLLWSTTVVPTVRGQAQSSGGAIEGTVSDESGAVLPGSAVTIRNQATGVTRETTTDSRGVYRAPLLSIGTYEVSATAEGFASVRVPDQGLTIGQTLGVDITLPVAAAQESITVTAEAPIIEGTRTHQASTVSARAVTMLPVNGRNFIDFVLTTPGVTRDVRLGDISFAGQRGTLNSLVVDGADNNNTFFGQALGRTGSGRAPYQFSQDAVAEFQVNRNAYSAEYGRAGGAVINVVTKSGSNDYHGSLFEFYRDKSLNENSWANKTAVPARPKSPYGFDQFGGSLGGPIRRDKAFFFISYDGQRNEIPNDVTLNANLVGLTLPTDAATQAGLASLRLLGNSWTRGQNQDVLLARADWQLSQPHRLTARYNRQEFTGTNFENGGATNAEQHTGDSLVNTDTINLTLSSVLSGNLFNEARGQWAKDKEPGEANSALPEATVRQGGRTLLTVGRNFFSPRETTIERYQIADALSWNRGAHGFKTGADYNHDDILNFFPGNFSGVYTFNSLAGWANGRPDSYVQAFAGPGTTGPTTEPNSVEYAAFFQDDWKPRKNLSVMAGLRYDLQQFAQPQVRNPDPQLAAAGIDTSFLKTDRDNIGPRLGLAWTPRERLLLRAGYGLFYGRTPAIMVGTAHSNNGINVQTITLTGAAAPTYPTILSSPPTGAAAARPSIFIFDADYEQPEVAQASLGADLALSDDIALGIGYLHVEGDKLQRSIDINVATPVATALPISTGGSVVVQQFPTARPFSNFARIIQFESSAESTYDGVTLELRRRFSGSYQWSVAYTLGKVEDTVPDATAVVPGGSDDAKFASNPADFDADRAPGANDQRHRLVVSGLWAPLGFREASGWQKALLDGWSFSWIAAYQSGQPYSEAIVGDANRDGNTRNDIVPGKRDSHRLPSTTTIDLRIARSIPFPGDVKLELIAEAFNLLDADNIVGQRNGRYNYVAATNSLTPITNFGTDSTAADNRILQLALKLTF